jgi:hypothetical protein
VGAASLRTDDKYFALSVVMMRFDIFMKDSQVVSIEEMTRRDDQSRSIEVNGDSSTPQVLQKRIRRHSTVPPLRYGW